MVSILRDITSVHRYIGYLHSALVSTLVHYNFNHHDLLKFHTSTHNTFWMTLKQFKLYSYDKMITKCFWRLPPYGVVSSYIYTFINLMLKFIEYVKNSQRNPKREL